MNFLKFPAHILLLLTVLLVSSCNNDDTPDPVLPNETLVNSELGTSLNQGLIQTFYGLMGSQYPEASGLAAEVKSGVNVYLVEYNTVFEGRNLVASGVVAVPAVAGNYPVLSFQRGTSVLYSEAPTHNYMFDISNPESTTALVESMASLGFVVVIADYPGFGSSEQVFHPYLEKVNTMASLTDLLFAARELLSLDEMEAKMNGQLYLAGYSQGGWSTMQLLKELEQAPFEAFDLQAASCGAGPYNLAQMNKMVLNEEEFPMPYYFAYLLHAYEQHGLIENPLDELFAEEYAAKIPGLFDFQTTGGDINAALTRDIDDLFYDDYLTGYDTDPSYQTVRGALADNSVQPWVIHTPTMMFHGNADVYVPFELSEDFYTHCINMGTSTSTLEFTVLEGADHASGVLPFAIQTINRFMEMAYPE